nr:AAC(3) family N-acetyltransferase [Enterovibrio paralichthyis]
MASSYTYEELVAAVRAVGVKENDILFCHSNVGFLGVPEGLKDRQAILELILSAIQDVIGEEGTLVVPTFTYSFGKNEIFDVDSSVSNCGAFSEFIRMHPSAFRSNDPSVSVAAIGRKAQDLTKNIPQDAYSEDSVFGRLVKQRVRIFNINFDAGTTLLHYLEKQCQVSYRFDKTFHGEKMEDGCLVQSASTLWVRDMDLEGSDANFDAFNRYVSNAALYKRCSVGRGSIGSISIEDVEQAFNLLYQQDAWFLTDRYTK